MDNRLLYVDPCPINTREVFGGSCKAEQILFRDHFFINAVRELAIEYLMR